MSLTIPNGIPGQILLRRHTYTRPIRIKVRSGQDLLTNIELPANHGELDQWTLVTSRMRHLANYTVTFEVQINRGQDQTPPVPEHWVDVSLEAAMMDKMMAEVGFMRFSWFEVKMLRELGAPPVASFYMITYY